MAIGIVNNDDFEAELNRLNGNSGTIEELPEKGRGKNPETPESLRKIIGEESIESGRASALGLARAFNISDSSVSAYSNGSTSTRSYHNPTSNLSNHLNKVKTKIQSRARSKLNLALAEITPEKLAEAKLRDVSGVARDMSAIIRNLEPESNSKETNAPQFIIYAPQIRDEKSFDVITVNE